MFDRLRVLKEKGYCPDTILDIGAHHGIWTQKMLEIYETANYYLFEGIQYDELDKYKADPKIKVYITVLNEKEAEVDWFQMKNTGDSFFREKSKHFVQCEILKKQTIDLTTLAERENLFRESKNIFIKIDCQGAEIPILKGAGSVLAKTDFILLEMPFFGQYNEGVPTFLEHIQYMDSIGFVPFDIVEHHYTNNYNMQVDIVFIKKTHPFTKDVNERLL